MLGSSTTQLAELLEAHTPCLILLDETLEYLNKALSVTAGDGNLAGTTLTFIKELCTAASNVAGAAVVATLTSSRLEDYASVAGEEMQERLSMVVGRTENIVTPVEGDDIFPILHRRLFTTLGDERVRRAVADAYAEVYESFSDAVPASYREAGYRERLVSAYPFHPELVDILTNRWGSLSGFQRTRGALRTLAHTVKSLTQHQHQGGLILPGDVDLADAGIRAEVLRFAGDSYKAALNSDIIRADAKGPLEDERRGGQVKEWRLATGLATTAFLNSFGAERVLGASTAQMLLGVARPGISRGLIDDVRDALAANAWYMRLEGGRYRFTTEPTLNKVVMEREGAVGDERVTAVVREAIGKVAPSTRVLRVVPRVDDSADLPDEPQLTLGILNLDQCLGRDTSTDVLRHAEQILHNRGASARTNKNAAMLVVADEAALRKARASARTLAALRDVKADPPRLSRFNKEQRDQLDDRLKAADERVPQQVAMAFRHLLLFSERDGQAPARSGRSRPGEGGCAHRRARARSPPCGRSARRYEACSGGVAGGPLPPVPWRGPGDRAGRARRGIRPLSAPAEAGVDRRPARRARQRSAAGTVRAGERLVLGRGGRGRAVRGGCPARRDPVPAGDVPRPCCDRTGIGQRHRHRRSTGDTHAGGASARH